MQNNAAPFGSTSPRQSLGSPTSESFGPTPRRRSPSPFDSLSNGSPRSLDGQAVLSAPPRRSSASSVVANGHGPLVGVPGSVAMNRALISNEGSPAAVETLLSVPGEEGASTAVPVAEPNGAKLAVPEANGLMLSSPASSRPTSPDPSSSSASIPNLHSSGLPQPASRPRSPLPSSNPFFGSSATTRERLSKSAASAQSGSGKVISGLQSDLLQARSALETTRGQLRLSQRAVEHLGRQAGASRLCIALWMAIEPRSNLTRAIADAEDLRETKERLSAEIEALNRQRSRKERLQEEALARARSAEASLVVVQKELAELKASVRGRMKELETGAKKAEELKVKAEREYASLRDGMRCVPFESPVSVLLDLRRADIGLPFSPGQCRKGGETICDGSRMTSSGRSVRRRPGTILVRRPSAAERFRDVQLNKRRDVLQSPRSFPTGRTSQRPFPPTSPR